MTSTNLLDTGSTVPIVSGGDYIHSLFHLDTPSLTVVVRTHSDPGTGPQFTYLPPHLAVDPFHSDALTMRRKQLLDVLEKTETPGYADVVMEMLRNLDFERGFFILQNCLGPLRNLGQWEEALETFRQKHGRLVDFVAPTLDEIVRRDGLVDLRSSVTEVEHRFFLALLLNVPDRSDILGMVEQRFSAPPAETILRWAGELVETSEIGTWILDAEFPPDLNVPLEDQGAIFLAALGCFLENTDPAVQLKSAGLSLQEVERIRDAFARSSMRALVV